MPAFKDTGYVLLNLFWNKINENILARKQSLASRAFLRSSQQFLILKSIVFNATDPNLETSSVLCYQIKLSLSIEVPLLLKSKTSVQTRRNATLKFWVGTLQQFLRVQKGKVNSIPKSLLSMRSHFLLNGRTPFSTPLTTH